MNILDKIIETKKVEVANQKKVVSVSQLEKYPEFSRKCNSLKANLLKDGASGVIAEFKQKTGEDVYEISAKEGSGLKPIKEFLYRHFFESHRIAEDEG